MEERVSTLDVHELPPIGLTWKTKQSLREVRVARVASVNLKRRTPDREKQREAERERQREKDR